MVKKFKTLYEKLIMKQLKEQLIKERSDNTAACIYGLMLILIIVSLFILVYATK